MFELLDKWIEAIRSTDATKILHEVMNAHQTDIIELNQEQLQQGIKSTGEPLSPYSAAYAKRKKKPLTPKNLYDEGDLYGQMYSSSAFSSTIVGSRDFKAKFHEAREGQEIFSLTTENLEKLIWEKGVAKDFVDRYTDKVVSQ